MRHDTLCAIRNVKRAVYTKSKSVFNVLCPVSGTVTYKFFIVGIIFDVFFLFSIFDYRYAQRSAYKPKTRLKKNNRNKRHWKINTFHATLSTYLKKNAPVRKRKSTFVMINCNGPVKKPHIVNNYVFRSQKETGRSTTRRQD